MPWSSKSHATDKSNVLKKSNENSLGSDISVLNYVPKQIQFGTPEAALEYLREKEKGSDFVMSDVLRQTTGVDSIEKISEETKIENKVLEKLALVQEEAYQKAYELGLEEGREKAYTERTNDINFNLSQLEEMMNHLTLLKEEMVQQNESHIIQLVYDIARRIAFDHIEEKPEVVISVIKHAIEMAQADEEVNVLICATQVDFLERMKNQMGREFEFLKKVRFQVSDQVTSGGCIVETNYGVVDARIEERVNKLWSEMKQALPRVKSPIT
ncbi:MAG: hypothetical protein A2622_08995 [Bdellovibrionales bacterium RIFCSPHIGHO2_01_FULL_40_29]|nr:MAG: hypothetical protein A2622_08995 [Bdellovibrionales bacterium RIFCSPHIGHO2_01_FULL_40_29]OFZ32871.1 MAG: hypothetical protein A3D17_09205 [Bdellovibrionales bacterium RIFCSPHIGHO2_02_FULL_40_15]